MRPLTQRVKNTAPIGRTYERPELGYARTPVVSPLSLAIYLIKDPCCESTRASKHNSAMTSKSIVWLRQNLERPTDSTEPSIFLKRYVIDRTARLKSQDGRYQHNRKGTYSVPSRRSHGHTRQPEFTPIGSSDYISKYSGCASVLQASSHVT